MLEPNIALLAILTTGVGVVMSRLALRSGLLRARIAPRRCPSCGLIVETRICPRCTGD